MKHVVGKPRGNSALRNQISDKLISCSLCAGCNKKFHGILVLFLRNLCNENYRLVITHNTIELRLFFRSHAYDFRRGIIDL